MVLTPAIARTKVHAPTTLSAVAVLGFVAVERESGRDETGGNGAEGERGEEDF